MKRTLITGLDIWKRKGLFWPARLIARALLNTAHGLPRGLMVEATQNCTGNCRGCKPTIDPVDLKPGLLGAWLECRQCRPVTLHFSGKHSDPLAAAGLSELVAIAGRHSSMVSVSTIGLGFRPGHERLRVDRWIFSLPAATGPSWEAIRGRDRMAEALHAVRTVKSAGQSMVELLLTVWKQSEGDLDAFRDLAESIRADSAKAVFGRFDPEGYHVGRTENLAFSSPDCPYIPDENGAPLLKHLTAGCPLAGCLFLDAEGVLRPCPFTGDDAPSERTPSAEAWKNTREWRSLKNGRPFSACRYCC
jgi:MoaA/NifB/PqqE/SkfB family radical SAM enzyme